MERERELLLRLHLLWTIFCISVCKRLQRRLKHALSVSLLLNGDQNIMEMSLNSHVFLITEQWQSATLGLSLSLKHLPLKCICIFLKDAWDAKTVLSFVCKYLSILQCSLFILSCTFFIKMPAVHELAKDFFSGLSVTVNVNLTRQAMKINRKVTRGKKWHWFFALRRCLIRMHQLVLLELLTTTEMCRDCHHKMHSDICWLLGGLNFVAFC